MEQGRDRVFADALREAVEARGLSLERIHIHLLTYGHDVSVATLSYWQTGRSVPVRRASLQALGALEAILQVPRGRLASRLPSQQVRRPAPRPATGLARNVLPAGAERIATEFGLGFLDGYAVVYQQQTLTIDANRGIAGAELDTIIVSERDGLDRVLAGFTSDIPGVLIDLTAGHGCRIGRTATVLRETLTVSEILLEQPLRSGEPYRYQTVARYDTPGVLVRDWSWYHPQRIRDASLVVRFPPDDLPECAVSAVYAGPALTDPPPQQIPRTAPETVLYRTDFGPGVMSAHWSWPDDPTEVIQPVRPLLEERA